MEQAIEEFAENEDCSPVEDVVKNPVCIAMAKRFGATCRDAVY